MAPKVVSDLENYNSFSMASNVIINANSGDPAKRGNETATQVPDIPLFSLPHVQVLFPPTNEMDQFEEGGGEPPPAVICF